MSQSSKGGIVLQIKTASPIKSRDVQAFLREFIGESEFTNDNFMSLVLETDETTALRILARFSETLNELKDHLELTLHHDVETIWMFCHKISSSAELLGFVDFSNKAKIVGTNIKDVSLDMKQKTYLIQIFSIEAENLRIKILSSCPEIKYYR